MSCIPQASEQGAGVAGGNRKSKITDAQTQGIENFQESSQIHLRTRAPIPNSGSDIRELRTHKYHNTCAIEHCKGRIPFSFLRKADELPAKV